MNNKLQRFVKKSQSDGFIQTIKLTIRYIFMEFCRSVLGISRYDMANIINAIRFRDIRIIFSCDMMRKLPKSTHIGHPTGIVINTNTSMGENIHISQNVTIGKNGKDDGTPTIEDNVSIYAGAVVLGDVTLEKGCVIGANSVVINDVKKNTTVVGAPATEV